MKGLHGTYKLPTVHDCRVILEEHGDENDDSSLSGMLAPLAPLLAKKTKSSQIFMETALDDDDA